MRTHILIYASSTVINVAMHSQQRTHTIIYTYVLKTPNSTQKRQRMLLSINSACSELSSWLLGGQQVESLLALHSLLAERIIRRKSCGMSAHGRVVVGVIELFKV